jgi:hypothetical protein
MFCYECLLERCIFRTQLLCFVLNCLEGYKTEFKSKVKLYTGCTISSRIRYCKFSSVWVENLNTCSLPFLERETWKISQFVRLSGTEQRKDFGVPPLYLISCAADVFHFIPPLLSSVKFSTISFISSYILRRKTHFVPKCLHGLLLLYLIHFKKLYEINCSTHNF